MVPATGSSRCGAFAGLPERGLSGLLGLMASVVMSCPLLTSAWLTHRWSSQDERCGPGMARQRRLGISGVHAYCLWACAEGNRRHLDTRGAAASRVDDGGG